MLGRVKRTTKIPSSFKDFVSSDVQEQPMVEEENWYLVQFEDEGQFYSVLPQQKVRHISPDDMGNPFEEGDYVDAEWPADGNLYDAKVVKIGGKTELRMLRIKLERERDQPKEKDAKVSHIATPTSTTGKGKAKKIKPAAKDSELDQEKENKKRKKEENKQKRLQGERKRKAELEQAKDTAKYFAELQNLPPLPAEPPTLPPLPCSSKDSQQLPRIPVESLSPKRPRQSLFQDYDIESVSSCDESDVIEKERCAQCIELKSKVQELEGKVSTLKRKLLESRKELQDKESGNTGNVIRTGDGEPSDKGAVTAGIVSPEVAKKTRMVPLVPGSMVYLHQDQKNAAFDPKPTILVRNLMRVFFKEDTLKASNYGGGGLKGYKKLDPKITSAIIGYAMDPQTIKAENRVNQARLTETINKMCNEARRGISKLAEP